MKCLPRARFRKKFIFTENSLIYGSAEYCYAELTQINIVNPPRPISNGVAQTRANGKCLTLAFEYSQKERFASALTCANEQILLQMELLKTINIFCSHPMAQSLRSMRIMLFCII